MAGSVLILALTVSLGQALQEDPRVPDEVKSQATVKMAPGVPFLSDAELEKALAEAGVSGDVSATVLEENRVARIDALHASLVILGIVAVLSLFFTDRVPKVQPGEPRANAEVPESLPAG